MLKRYLPPILKSILQVGELYPFGPHHSITRSGSVQAFHTNSGGASKILVMVIVLTSVAMLSPAGLSRGPKAFCGARHGALRD